MTSTILPSVFKLLQLAASMWHRLPTFRLLPMQINGRNFIWQWISQCVTGCCFNCPHMTYIADRVAAWKRAIFLKIIIIQSVVCNMNHIGNRPKGIALIIYIRKQAFSDRLHPTENACHNSDLNYYSFSSATTLRLQTDRLPIYRKTVSP